MAALRGKLLLVCHLESHEQLLGYPQAKVSVLIEVPVVYHRNPLGIHHPWGSGESLASDEFQTGPEHWALPDYFQRSLAM